MLVDFLENTQVIIEFAKDQSFVFCCCFSARLQYFLKSSVNEKNLAHTKASV